MHVLAGARRRICASLLAAASIAVFAAAPARADDCPFADATADTATTDQIDAATTCLLNQRRELYGLKPLSTSAPLAQTASDYAAHMVATQRFSHIDEYGHNVFQRVLQVDPGAADRWDTIGENLGWGTDSFQTPRSMVTAWMNSAEHRYNILFPYYDEMGVGVSPGVPAAGQSGGLTYVTVYGEPVPQVDPALAPAAPLKHRRKKPHRARAAHHRHRHAKK